MTVSIVGLLQRISPPGVAPAGWAPREVGVEELSALLGAARVAPSADNLQIWRFVSVRAEETRRRLAEAVPEPLRAACGEAPLLLAACGVKALVTRARREQPFSMVDVPIAFSHLLLQAAELGLASAWTLDPDEARVRVVLGIPPEVRVVALLALGWPA